MSTENKTDFKDLREIFGRFRILIVGRANAGKTTILQAICNTTEKPRVYDGHGNKVRIQVDVCRRVYAKLRDQIDPSQVKGSRGVGIVPRRAKTSHANHN
jgi:GTPase SAR1 family protein